MENLDPLNIDAHTTSIHSDEEMLSFLDEFCTFGKNRVYLLMLIARSKENDAVMSSDEPVFREILTDSETVNRKYGRHKALVNSYIPEEGAELTYRFYISANARDVQKSFFQYQNTLSSDAEKMLQGHTPTRKKIKRLDKNWKSTLATQGNKDESRFVIDIDTKDIDLVTPVVSAVNENTDIYKIMDTPNGYHLYTDSFAFPLVEELEEDYVEVKRDGLLFLTKIDQDLSGFSGIQ